MPADVMLGRAWLTAALLFAFMLINFADKAVLGLSAVSIIDEFHLSHAAFGLIGTSFFALFSLSALVMGFVVNRVPTRWALAGMALVWSLCQLPMVATAGVAALYINRVVLGLGEGPAYPVALHGIYKWFPPERRPLPSSVISIGGAVGVGVVAPAVVYVIQTWSWRVAFGLLGVVGLVWLVLWLALGREGPLTANTSAAVGEQRVPYRALLLSRTFIGGICIGFPVYWMLTLAVVWLPAYLHVAAGYTPTEVGWIVALPPLCQIVLSPSICAWSEALRRRGVSSRVALGVVAGVCALIAGVATIALPFAGGATIVCTAIAFSIGTIIFAVGHVLVAEITPVRQRGAMLGINNAVATLAGPLAPVVTGLIIDVGANSAAGFRGGFLFAGGLVVVGALAGLALIDPAADRARFRRGGVPVLVGVGAAGGRG